MKKFAILFLLALSTKMVGAQTILSAYETHFAGADPQMVVVADINGDNLNDVVLATDWYFDPLSDGKLLTFLQDQSHQLISPNIQTQTTYHPDGGIEGIDTYDFNDDGLDDLAICYDDTFAVFQSLGDGTFQVAFKQYTGTDADGLAIGDLDHDGIVDVAISHWNSEHLSLFWGDTTSFTFEHSIMDAGETCGYNEVAITPFGNSSTNSLLFMCGQTLAAGVHVINFDETRYTTTAMFFQHSAGTQGIPNDMTVGDMTDDGFRELVISRGGNQPNCSVAFFEDTTQQSQTSDLFPIMNIPEAIVAGQIDCLPGDELVVAHGGWNTLSVIGQSGIQEFDLPYASHYEPKSLALGDINNDGLNDVVIADYNNGLLVLYNQSCSVTVSTETLNDPSEQALSIYPNPTMNEVHIRAQGNVQVMLYDNLGKLLMKNQLDIDMTSFPAGIYIVDVLLEDGSRQSEKFVKL